MTTAIFKSTGAIIVYFLVAIGLLATAGFNYWGWFGGSDAWKASHPEGLTEGGAGSGGGITGTESSSRGTTSSARKGGGNSLNPANDCVPNNLVFDFGNQKRHIEYLGFESNQPCPPYIQCNNVKRNLVKDWHDTQAVCIYGNSPSSKG